MLPDSFSIDVQYAVITIERHPISGWIIIEQTRLGKNKKCVDSVHMLKFWYGQYLQQTTQNTKAQIERILESITWQ